MNVKVKLENGAILPTFGTTGAAGADLYALTDVTLNPGERMIIQTGVSMEIPEGYFCFVTGRSGNTIKKGLHVALGTIDCDYRGNIGVISFNLSNEVISFKKGDRVAQLIMLPYISPYYIIVDELSETDRNTGGYGSTGK